MSPQEKSLEAVKNCLTLILRADVKGAEAMVVTDCLKWLNCCKDEYEKLLEIKPEEAS